MNLGKYFNHFVKSFSYHTYPGRGKEVDTANSTAAEIDLKHPIIMPQISSQRCNVMVSRGQLICNP